MVDGCVTDDGDAFLFGAQRVYANFTCDKNKVKKFISSDFVLLDSN